MYLLATGLSGRRVRGNCKASCGTISHRRCFIPPVDDRSLAPLALTMFTTCARDVRVSAGNRVGTPCVWSSQVAAGCQRAATANVRLHQQHARDHPGAASVIIVGRCSIGPSGSKGSGLAWVGLLAEEGGVSCLADAMLEPEVSSAELSTAATAGKRGNRISKGGGEITSRRSRHRLRRPATGPFACPLPLGSALDRATLRQDVSSGGWAASYQV